MSETATYYYMVDGVLDTWYATSDFGVITERFEKCVIKAVRVAHFKVPNPEKVIYHGPLNPYGR